MTNSIESLDAQIEMSKRMTRTKFMQFRRAACKWEPRPMPEDFMRRPNSNPIWLDAATPIPLTRPRANIDPLVPTI